ncbi:MAG: biotin transporter BioY [Chlamydiota bacterium]
MIISLFSPFIIRLPFTLVPIATQGTVVLLLAALLGSKRGALAVLAFLFQGAIGLPVFAGGSAGVMALAGPCGGYLLGYVVGAYITGYLMERSSVRSASTSLMAMAVGNAAIFGFGWAWLSCFIGMKSALIGGVLPFLPGDLLKLLIATRSLKSLRFFNV